MEQQFKTLVIVSIILIGFSMLVSYQIGVKDGQNQIRTEVYKANKQIEIRDSVIKVVTERLELFNSMLDSRKEELKQKLQEFNEETEKLNEANTILKEKLKKQ